MIVAVTKFVILKRCVFCQQRIHTKCLKHFFRCSSYASELLALKSCFFKCSFLLSLFGDVAFRCAFTPSLCNFYQGLLFVTVLLTQQKVGISHLQFFTQTVLSFLRLTTSLWAFLPGFDLILHPILPLGGYILFWTTLSGILWHTEPTQKNILCTDCVFLDWMYLSRRSPRYVFNKFMDSVLKETGGIQITLF